MRVIARATLVEFWEKHPRSKGPLEAWYDEAKRANWSNTHDVKEQYRSADFVKDNRVIFNIAGNKFRLVVHINYPAKIVLIKFLGTHSQYDKINPSTVNLSELRS